MCSSRPIMLGPYRRSDFGCQLGADSYFGFFCEA
jgi:hypothetical protein